MVMECGGGVSGGGLVGGLVADFLLLGGEVGTAQKGGYALRISCALDGVYTVVLGYGGLSCGGLGVVLIADIGRYRVVVLHKVPSGGAAALALGGGGLPVFKGDIPGSLAVPDGEVHLVGVGVRLAPCSGGFRGGGCPCGLGRGQGACACARINGLACGLDCFRVCGQKVCGGVCGDGV